MKNKKINVKKSIFRISIVIAVIFGLILAFYKIFSNGGSGSINDNARKYRDNTCTVYYPDNAYYKKYAKQICDKEVIEQTYDYALIPYGDYYLVSYPEGTKFFMDKNNNPLVIDSLSNECREVVSDYLRYEYQKEEVDEAYSLDFLEKSYYKNLDLTDKKTEINGTTISIYLEEFDRTVSFPVFAVQDYLNINLGESSKTYIKPHYVSKNRKKCILTFDEGPSLKNSPKIIDALYQYGGNATFFILGNRTNQEAIDMIEDSIRKGNVYGSRTENNKNLTLIEDDDEIYYEIMSPANLLANGEVTDEYTINGINYNMQFYRPPYGLRNERIDNISPLIAINWDIDTEDWKYRDEEHLYNTLIELDENDFLDEQIVLIHDSFSESADATVRAIKELVKRGYQFINISEYFDLIDFDYNKKHN